MPPVFDRAELLDRVGNDMAFLSETIDMLVADGRSLMADIQKAVQAGDAAGVGRSAHALKGMISNFCAPGPQEAALAVEKLGKSGDLSGAPEALKRVGEQLEVLIAELQQ